MKVDINLLPEEYRPKRWVLPLTVGLIVVILAAGYYGYGFYDKNASANGELEQLQSQLDSINAETEKVIKDSPIKDYQERIAETQVGIDSLKAMELDYEIRNVERIYWKPVLQTIRELAPTDIELTNFEQDEDEITVEGELNEDVQDAIVIVEYAKLLETRGIFSRIAFEIETKEIVSDEDGKTKEIFVFTMLLEVDSGGTQ